MKAHTLPADLNKKPQTVEFYETKTIKQMKPSARKRKRDALIDNSVELHVQGAGKSSKKQILAELIAAGTPSPRYSGATGKWYSSKVKKVAPVVEVATEQKVTEQSEETKPSQDDKE